MKIAPEHAKAEREGARIGVEERLLLDWVALNAADVSEWNAQVSFFIEANLADT